MQKALGNIVRYLDKNQQFLGYDCSDISSECQYSKYEFFYQPEWTPSIQSIINSIDVLLPEIYFIEVYNFFWIHDMNEDFQCRNTDYIQLGELIKRYEINTFKNNLGVKELIQTYGTKSSNESLQ